MQRERHLEGLRGYAALIVVLSHCAGAFWPALHGWPSNSEVEAWQAAVYNSPLAFFYNGTVCVYIFFVLSGFVLSVGFFQTDQPQVIQNLFVRRYTRLALPIVAACLLCAVIWSFGWFAAYRVPMPPWLPKFYRPEAHLGIRGALSAGFVDALLLGRGKYGFVLWTMSVEFYGSLLVFANCLLLRDLRRRYVLYCLECLVVVYTLGDRGALFACFILGIWLADLPRFRWPFLASAVTLAAAIYLGAYHGRSTIHAFLNILSVKHGNWNISAAAFCYVASSFLFVAAALYSPMVKRFLSARMSVWLGSISFSLYLTHSVVLCSLGVAVFATFRSGLAYNDAAFIAASATVSAALLVAWLFRPIDRWAIRLSHMVGTLWLPSREPIPASTPLKLVGPSVPIILEAGELSMAPLDADPVETNREGTMSG